MGDADLTPSERRVISQLPSTASEIAEDWGVTPNNIRLHISHIRDKGVDIGIDHGTGVYYLPDQPKVRRVSTKATGTKTKEANNYVTEVESAVIRRLRAKPELVTPLPTSSGAEDIVLHLTDLHIGDLVEDEHGNVIYNTDIAVSVVDYVTQKTIQLKETMGAMLEFDTLHVLWGGDMITNENIYEGQAFDIEAMLADQMSAAVGALTRQVKSLSEEFDAINVVAQPGNHGKTRASGVSKQANMDLVTYRWIDDRLREAGLSNVNFTTSETTWFKTFPLRGGEWHGFLTHGNDSAKHVDSTAASSRDWRGWLNEFNFDVAYRGHYHESRREPVQNGPMVFESPSPKPPSEWVSQIGYGSVTGQARRLATVHGVSNERPVTWEFVIDDSEMLSG